LLDASIYSPRLIDGALRSTLASILVNCKHVLDRLMCDRWKWTDSSPENNDLHASQPSAFSFFRHRRAPHNPCDPHAQPRLRIDCDEGMARCCTRDAILAVVVRKPDWIRTISNFPSPIADYLGSAIVGGREEKERKGAFSTFNHRPCPVLSCPPPYSRESPY
jgi:hypothetical protein